MTETRLSALQKRIIGLIAEYINNNGGRESLAFMPRAELFYAVYPERSKDRKEYLARQSVFSRSIRDLVLNKGLVTALALAWMLLDNTHEDHYAWQGGGRPKAETIVNVKYGPINCPRKTPHFRMFDLNEAGWKIAQELPQEVVNHG